MVQGVPEQFYLAVEREAVLFAVMGAVEAFGRFEQFVPPVASYLFDFHPQCLLLGFVHRLKTSTDPQRLV
jgi:hypothetical protein